MLIQLSAACGQNRMNDITQSHTIMFIISMLSFRVNNHISLVKYIDKWSKCAFQSTPKITRRRRAMTIFFHFPLLYVCLSSNSRHRRLISGPSTLTYSTLFFSSCLLLNSLSISLRSSSKAERKWQIHSRDLKWKFNKFLCRKLTKLNGRKLTVALSMDSSSPRQDSV